MADLWRISNRPSLSGEGGLRYAARWHSAGRRIVYLAESPAGAMLEVLVHLELDEDDLPPSYTLLRVRVAGDVRMMEMDLPAGEAWKTDLLKTRRLGDGWLAGGASALMRVPSVILPNTMNVLLNPLHADAARVEVVESKPAAFDLRLLQHLRG